jgi:flagellar motor switch protein FliN
VAGAEELEPAHEDALRTAANQIAAAAGPSLTPLLARSLTFAPAAIELAEDPASLPWSSTAADGPTWLITAEVSWGPGARAQFVLTTGTDLATEIDTISREVRGPEALPSRMELILDITLPVTVELGRARMQIQDILKLGPGSIVELEKSAGDPVELLINERPIARGEVVVIDENFGIRLTSIVTPTERIKTLR